MTFGYNDISRTFPILLILERNFLMHIRNVKSYLKERENLEAQQEEMDGIIIFF